MRAVLAFVFCFALIALPLMATIAGERDAASGQACCAATSATPNSHFAAIAPNGCCAAGLCLNGTSTSPAPAAPLVIDLVLQTPACDCCDVAPNGMPVSSGCPASSNDMSTSACPASNSTTCQCPTSSGKSLVLRSTDQHLHLSPRAIAPMLVTDLNDEIREGRVDDVDAPPPKG